MKDPTIKLKGDTVSTKWMTLRYIFALGLIALLSISSYSIVKNILAVTKGSAAIINISGQQRMLCQRIAYLSEKYADQHFQKIQNKTLPLLLSAIKLMKETHNRLVHGDITANLPGNISKKIHSMYFDSPMYLDRRLHEFITEAIVITKTPPTKAIKSTHCFLYINSVATHTLLNDLNAVVKQYQVESEAVITKLQRLEVGILIITLIVLLMIALFIFRPMVTRVRLETLKLINAGKKIHAIADTVGDGIVTVNTENRIIFVNQELCHIFQYLEDDLLGKSLTVLLKDSVNTHKILLNNLIKQTENAIPNPWFELEGQRKDHTKLPLEIRINQTQINDVEDTAFTVSIRDITDRLQTEEALRRSQKMEVIGQLSGGIAHDFNNQLGVVIGYLDILKKHLPIKQKKARQWLDTAIKASQRCIDLTRQLLAFSRTQTQEKTAACLNDTLKELNGVFTRSLTPEVDLQYSLDDKLWLTEINLGEFQDAILNLIINARDAMPNGGKLRLETSNKHLDADYTETNPTLNVGDYIELSVSDTGTGMDKNTLEHIFEPFFTTKPAGEGTGLGLAMVYGFFKRYGGYVKVDSTPGAGTTIRLYLPRSKIVKSTSIGNDTQATELSTGNEHILIVDDERSLLELADKYLSDQGYRTYTAENAAQALDILMNNKEIELLFTDVIMPGEMNGYELAEHAAQRYPQLKILLTSGLTSKGASCNNQAKFAAHLLAKPYRKTGLIKRIRLILDDKT